MLVKLGGSVLTDKAEPRSFRRGVASRLMAELAKSKAPLVLLHGAGSFGHPAVARTGLGRGPLDAARRDAVAEVFAHLAELESKVLAAALSAGLRPVPVPLHVVARYGQGDEVVGLPVEQVAALLADGWTPVLHGTLVPHPRTGWAVLGADRMMAELAGQLEPRLAIFATDVEGVYDRDPKSDSAARLLGKVAPDQVQGASGGTGWDVTGRMAGKLQHAFEVAQVCPTWVVNGLERGRVADAMRAKPVTGTRIESGRA